MKVIIAEDEILERKMMKKFLEENFSDITVVGEAANGRMAIELSLRLKPDIILMDIKMPGINGIEAIEKINRSNPLTKFILVSAYDSFNYAKQAMKLGVKEYILKPSKKEEMISAILRVIQEVNDEQKQLDSEKNSVNIAKELFISKIINNDVNEDLFELQQSLFPQFHSGFFFVMEGIDFEQLEMIERMISKHTSDSFIIQKDEKKCTVLLISNEKQAKASLLQLARKLQLGIGEQAYIGVGYPHTKLENVPKSYQEAVQALNYLKEMKNRNYGFPNDKQVGRKEVTNHLLLELEAGNEKAALSILTSILDNPSTSSNETLLELFYKIKQGLEDKVTDLSDQSYYQLKTRQDWFDFIKLTCLHIQSYYQSQDKMERAKKYIEENYNQPLSLEDVSRAIDLSTNYFSNLFKEATGETFIDYVTNIRLNKAKLFLQENHYSLKEISFKVGYKDPNYFSRVFKKYFDLSPKQYQQQILKK